LRAKAVTAALLAILFAAAAASAADIGALEAKVGRARGEAGALASRLQGAQAELAAAQQEAASAGAREERLSHLLAVGRERAAAMARHAERAQRRLAVERRRLHRARGALARRLVSIYESGSPSEASVILSSTSFDDMATRASYLDRIQESDAALASRVAGVRNEVRTELRRVGALKAKVEAYDEGLSAARSQISAVRARAEAAEARLHSVAAARSAALSSVKSQIEGWVSDIQAARAAEAERISAAEAEEEVGRWLGGPYSIPAYIVMCESGGDYGAVNPSSGAGGAYQILPSTWALYGGNGAPQNAPKSEQDAIAAKIWADSGPSAWVCG
jgi:peptidoglycan hydrolase CwlO-like protein